MKRVIKAATGTNFDFESYGIDRSEFDLDQLYEIKKGLRSGVDVSVYADPKFDDFQMYSIREGLESGVDVSVYADLKFTGRQMLQIMEGLKSGVDISWYADPKFSSAQMDEIRKGLESGIDVSMYADPELDWKQMEEIRVGTEKGPDVSAESYTESLSWDEPVSIQEYYPWQESEFYAEASDEDLIEHCEENGIGFFETLGEACQAYHDNNSNAAEVLYQIDKDYGNNTTPIPLRGCGDWKDQQNVYLDWLSEFYPEEYKAYSRDS